jgi:hypothetical protein
LDAKQEPFRVENMKFRCPECGIEGFIQVRGRNVMIQHYVGFRDGKRIYTYHKIPFEMLEGLQVNASKNMQVNEPESVYNCENMVARERFELSSAAPEAAMFDHCTTGLLNRTTTSNIG